MPIKIRGEIVMKTLNIFTASAIFLLLPRTILAEEVTLPTPVIEWGFYILLVFAACVTFGVFFYRRGINGKDKKSAEKEFLSSLFNEQQPPIYSVRPDDSISECVRKMNEHKIGAVLVMVDDLLLGIFTERDALTRVLGSGLDPFVTKVDKVMTKHPYCVSPRTTLDEAMNIVTSKRFRHLPVVEDGKVTGMVSSGDLTHRLVKGQPAEVQELVDIAARRGASL